jgi:hypothetical protein
MRSAAAFALAIALAASSAASAQGVGLRPGATGAGSDVGWNIAPALSARVGYRDLDYGAPPTALYALDPAAHGAGGIGSLNGMVDPSHRLAPYLGIGYGNVPRVGMNFYFDLGVVYQDAPGAADAGAVRYSLERSLNKYNLYPVGQVGIRLGF